MVNLKNLARGYVASTYLSDLPEGCMNWESAFLAIESYLKTAEWGLPCMESPFSFWDPHSPFTLEETFMAMTHDAVNLEVLLISLLSIFKHQAVGKMKAAFLTYFLEENIPDLSWTSSFDFLQNLDGVNVRTKDLQNSELQSLGVLFDSHLSGMSLDDIQNHLRAMDRQIRQGLNEVF